MTGLAVFCSQLIRQNRLSFPTRAVLPDNDRRDDTLPPAPFPKTPRQMAVLAISSYFHFVRVFINFFSGGGTCTRPPPRTPMSTESTPLKRSPKTLLQVISWAVFNAVRNLVQIRPWGLLEKWVKYNEYVYLNTFFRELTYRSDPSKKNSRSVAQTTRTRAKGLIFFGGGFVDTVPYFWA